MHIRQDINLTFPGSPKNKSMGPQKTRNIQLHIENNFEQIKIDLQKLKILGHALRVSVEVSRCELEDYLWLVQKQREGLIYQLNLTDEGHKVFPTVAIVVFTFNRLKYTEQALNRLMNSTQYPFDLYIIDNNSTDGTIEWLEEFKFAYANRIESICYNKKNMGLPGPTNQFWQSVSTDLIGKVDNDTLVPNGWLERLVEAHNKISNLAVVGGYHFRPEDFDDKAAQAKIYKENGISILTDSHIGGCCYLMKKTVQENFGLMDVHPTLKTHGWTQYQWKLVKAGFIIGYLYPPVQLDYMDDPRSEKCLIKKYYSDYTRSIWRERGINFDSTDQIVKWIRNDAKRVTSSQLVEPHMRRNKSSVISSDNKKSPLVSLIILVHNQIKFTKLCLESILANTSLPIEIIVVDNGSTDGTKKYLESASGLNKPNASLCIIQNAYNLGFAAGNNRGIAVAQGDYIVLMNNDVVVTSGWLERLIECVENHPKAGIIGPRSNYVSGPQLVREIGYNTVNLQGLETFAKQFSKKNYRKSSRIIRVVGFCMLIKRQVIEKIGGLDRRYGLGNFEDDDFSLRAAISGFESWVAEDCFIHHFGSRTFAGSNIDYEKSLEKNWELFKEKWGLPKDAAYGSPYSISRLKISTFNPRYHYIPLPVKGDELYKNQLVNSSDSEPAEINTLLENAICLFQKGLIEKGVEAFLLGIRRFPADHRVYISFAEQLINCGRYQDALDALNEIPNESSGYLNTSELQNTDIELLEGYCQEGLGNYEVASRIAAQVLKNQPDHHKALNLRGLVAYRKNQKNIAENYFLQAIESDPDYGEAFTNLGCLRWEFQDTTEALRLFELGFSLTPTDLDIAAAYHEAVTEINEFKRAEPIVRKALERFPYSKKIQYILIDVLIKLGKLKESMAQIENAISTCGIENGLMEAALKIRAQIGPIKINTRKQKRATVSLCMIVKNEQEFLAQCLASVKPIVDEIIIVDTGSTDRTKDIATIFGAQVFDFEWADDFAAARNYSISKSKGDWILIMDADEAFSPQDYTRFRKLTKNKHSGIVAYSIVTRNYCNKANTIGWKQNDGQYAHEEAGIGWIPSEKVRLFSNNEKMMFEGAVHEMVDPVLKRLSINALKSTIPVHHYGSLNAGKMQKKGQLYLNIGKKKLLKNGRDINAIRELAIQATSLQKSAEAIELWKNFISMKPGEREVCEAYVNMVTAYIQKRDYVNALIFARKAVKIYPKSKEVQLNLGLAELFNGNTDAALEILEVLLSGHPDFPPARFLFSASKCFKKKTTDMNSDMVELKKSFPAQFLVYSVSGLAEELIAADQCKLASIILQNSIESEIINKDILNLYANCLEKIKEQGKLCDMAF